MSKQLQGFSEEQAKEIKEKYPKFYRDVKGHLMGVDELPPDFEKMVPENVLQSSDTLVNLMLTTTSFRDLYDFFDKKKIICSILDTKKDGATRFIATIDDIEVRKDDTLFFPTRIEAELTMFKKAIEYYEL